MIRKYLRLAAACGFLLTLSANCFAFLGDLLFLPPHAGYQTIETRHFSVVYPGKFESEANLSAVFLEDAYAVLTKAFDYAPSRKCTIILADNQDYANGVTSAVGLQGIVLFLTAPDPYSSIGEYDHWLRNLIIHEYSHYVTLEQTRGLFELGRYIFGNLLFPNHFWPTWIAEGMAVYAESAFTHRGRGHGTYYSTLTRDGILRGRLGTWDFLEFDRLSGPVPDFPFGEAAYYAGYAMIDEMLEHHGDKAASRYAENSSWRIPFFIDGTLENISQDGAFNSFRSLWEGWIRRQSKLLKPEIDWLRSQGAPDPEFLTPEGASALGARISPDGTRIAYTFSSGHERPSIKIQDLNSKEVTKIDDALSGASLAWSADGKTLYYGKTDFRGPYSFYSDLYAYDGSVHRITDGERAKDPAFCGDRLIYTTQRGRFSEIRAVKLGGDGEIRVLYRAPEHSHVSNPRCTPDYKKIIFAEHGTEPLEAMYSIAAQPGTGARANFLFGGAAQGFGALFPEPLANGDIYFTRVVGGYYDLARWDASTKKVVPVARSSGGYWTPGIAQTLWPRAARMSVSYVSTTGIRAAVVDPRKLEATYASAIAKAPSAETSGDAHPALPSLDASARNPILERHGYNLLTSLAPRIWTPYIALGDSQNQFGANILGWDDTDQLEYNIFAWYDTISRAPEGILATYHRLASFKLGFSVSSQVTDYLVDSSNSALYDDERKFTLSLSRPFPGAFTRFTPTLIAEWARTYRRARTSDNAEIGHHLFEPDQRLGADLDFDNVQRYAYSILSEKGTRLKGSVRRYFTQDARAWKGLASWNQFVPLWPQHGLLNLNVYAVVAPNPSASIVQSLVHVGGRGTLSDLDPPLRGYPLGNFQTRRAGVFQAEYHLPLAQLFRGFETWPIFMQNLGAYGFYDGAKMQRIESDSYAPFVGGIGGGLLVNTFLGYSVPVQIRLEYSHGLRKDLNGQDAFFAGVSF